MKNKIDDDTIKIITEGWVRKTKQIADEAYIVGKSTILAEYENDMVDFIEQEYPKGISKDRGTATVALARFLIYLKNKNVEAI